MMGRKQKLKNVREEDVVYARHHYCYLANNNKLVKWTKRKMNKRMRRELKRELYKEV